MTAYYSEIDPFAAAWLRELIKAGHIAPGEVDERSIADVMPSDLAGFTQCHFFAGIGVWSYALRQAGWPDDRPVWTGSTPCQPFSSAGKGKGFKDERHLWPEFYRLISQCRPTVCFGEQVASKDGLTWVELVQDNMESAGYAFGAVDTCSAGFGAPHIRQRMYWVGADTLGNAALRGRVGGEVGNEAGPQCTALGSRKNERCGRHDTANDGACLRLAHADNAGRQLLTHAEPAGICRKTLTESEQLQQLGSDSTSICGVADSKSAGSSHGRTWTVFPVIGFNDGKTCRLANTKSTRRGILNAENLWATDAQVDTFTNASDSPADEQQRFASEHPGPTNGFWGAADWLLCRDGKWRAVEPGAFPLASSSSARVGRLRGYGNAINAEQAKAFIEAFMEVNR